MGMRKWTRCLMVAGVLMVGTAACGDKTVTSQPPVTTIPKLPAVNGDDDATSADLQVVEQLLRDVDGDITATEQDRATPEGDPAQ